ncbi:MAG: radical SAM protein [Acidobacteriota bacterium]|jgi:nitrogen fixation protein NifB|nr:radical SAM protein [Acidobacteriota bacterium]
MTQSEIRASRAFSDHPCFYGSARARRGRVHLPVAPDCNIRCNFCNRLYDCANESRPAVTQGILAPDNVIPYLDFLLRRRRDISVVGIAGPGDSMCSPERTLETLRDIHAAYPHLLICVSTNGLNLAGHVDDLAEAGVTHVTVTVNAVDPLVGRHIYSHVTVNNREYHGVEAFSLLLSRQKEAIRQLKAKNLIVKVNTVVIPGINDDHVRAIAKEAAGLGVDVMNCIPMIPVEGTPFERLKSPTDREMSSIRDLASLYIPQMYHCQRCRADAAGLLSDNELTLNKTTIRFERFQKQASGFAGCI